MFQLTFSDERGISSNENRLGALRSLALLALNDQMSYPDQIFFMGAPDTNLTATIEQNPHHIRVVLNSCSDSSTIEGTEKDKQETHARTKSN